MEERELIQVSLKLPASALDSLSRLAEQLHWLAAAASAGRERDAVRTGEQGVNGSFDFEKFSGLMVERDLPAPPAADGAVQEISGAGAVRQEIAANDVQAPPVRQAVEMPVEDPAPAGASGPEFREMEDAGPSWEDVTEWDEDVPEAWTGGDAAVEDAARVQADPAASVEAVRPAESEVVRDAPDVETAGTGEVDSEETVFPALPGVEAAVQAPAAARREVGMGPDMPVSRWDSGGFYQTVRTAAPVTAESISRAFQRDGRRYDGGFPLY